ncbi:uncharacterized protein UDID_17356 [Ustilago sp. UG-2017a]|nr:uncharacterized protein UDID_17356 [Ustilago sp. UG-2017a]
MSSPYAPSQDLRDLLYNHATTDPKPCSSCFLRIRSHDTNHITFAPTFTLAYVCLLRCTEFTWSHLDDFVLQVGSITWSETYTTLHLACSKTDPFRTAVNLIFPKAPLFTLTEFHSGDILNNSVAPFSHDRVGVLQQLLGKMGLPASVQWDAGLPTVSAGTSFTPLPRAESWPPPTSSQPLPPPLLSLCPLLFIPPLLGLAHDSSASSSCLLQQNRTLLCNQFAPRTLAVREPLEPMSTLTLIPQS